uniref:Thioredoxin domain-containing protein n=1 Tax=Odontella aurita TaxID=265563 RepID=A0A7S4IYC1_9STRA|mmetsp:Transcript_32739/g.97715  ORF Transcript_32739/g.97715 Transcript_32739/m.97715 type:complete len:196 (+) Transcript_32739:253-840(+)
MMAKSHLPSLLLFATCPLSQSFASFASPKSASFGLNLQPSIHIKPHHGDTRLKYIDEEKSVTDMIEECATAPVVSGAQLEAMMGDWVEGPLVVDAFATWCGPCMRMSEDFDSLARELNGSVRLVKLDIDRDPNMAGRLGISSVPTLLFLDHFEGESNGEGKQPKAVLKEKIEGAIGRETMKALCEQHFLCDKRTQ